MRRLYRWLRAPVEMADLIWGERVLMVAVFGSIGVALFVGVFWS